LKHGAAVGCNQIEMNYLADILANAYFMEFGAFASLSLRVKLQDSKEGI
jgi:hypothetical protein